MRRVLIALIFFCLLIIGCTLGYRAIHATVTHASEDISVARSALEGSDFQNAAAQLTRSYAYWNSRRSLLGALLHHKALDTVDTLYQRTMQYIAESERTHALTELAELSAVLGQLLDTEAPTLENIL